MLDYAFLPFNWLAAAAPSPFFPTAIHLTRPLYPRQSLSVEGRPCSESPTPSHPLAMRTLAIVQDRTPPPSPRRRLPRPATAAVFPVSLPILHCPPPMLPAGNTKLTPINHDRIPIYLSMRAQNCKRRLQRPRHIRHPPHSPSSTAATGSQPASILHTFKEGRAAAATAMAEVQTLAPS